MRVLVKIRERLIHIRVALQLSFSSGREEGHDHRAAHVEGLEPLLLRSSRYRNGQQRQEYQTAIHACTLR